MSIWNNLRKRGLRDILNPKKWKIFSRFLRKKVTEKVAKEPEENLAEIYNKGDTEITHGTLKEYSELWNAHELEQIAHRMGNLGCRECLRDGECYHCGCVSPDLFYDRTNWCSGNHWGTMLSEREWNKFKALHGIEVDYDYVKQIRKHGKIVKFK